MKDSDIQKSIGQKVLVFARGLQFVGVLVGRPEKFDWRDVLVQLPGEKKPRQFYASKVEKIKEQK
jgi:hypothetical protein